MAAAHRFVIVLLGAFAVYTVIELALFLPSSFTGVMREAWGRLIFADLLVGLAIFSAWVVYRERSAARAALWIASFLVLGNLGTLAYLLVALRGSGRQGGWTRFFHGHRAAVAMGLVMAMALSPVQAKDAEQKCVKRTCFPTSAMIGKATVPLRGAALLEWIGFDVYTAAFYVGADVKGIEPALGDTPRKLVLHYHRKISRKDIATSSEKLVRKNAKNDMEKLRERLDRVYALYEDVGPGDEYHISYEPGVGTTIELNGRKVCTVEGEDFARAFFGIWLSEKPVDEKLRDVLLGSTGEDNPKRGQ